MPWGRQQVQILAGLQVPTGLQDATEAAAKTTPGWSPWEVCGAPWCWHLAMVEALGRRERGEREREVCSSPKHCKNRLASPQHFAIYGLTACFQGDGCEGMMRGGRGLQERCSGGAPGRRSPAGPAPCPHCCAALGDRGWAPGGKDPEQCCCRPHKRPHSASSVRGVPTQPGGDAGSPRGCFKAQHRRQAPSCQSVQEGTLGA